MKILTFGRSGQLARALKRTQPDTVELIQLSRQQVDITRPQLINDALAFYKPDIIINCAAYTDVEKAQYQPNLAMEINSLAVEYIAKAANKFNIKLIQLSTDYVFDGQSSTPYSVTQTPSAIIHTDNQNYLPKKRYYVINRLYFASYSVLGFIIIAAIIFLPPCLS